VRLKSRITRLETQMRDLRCASCLFSIYDVAPPLPFLPNAENFELAVFACCWKCGARFNITGNILRERQVYALFFSTPTAQVYTDERARAVFAYVIRLGELSQKRAEARETKAEVFTYKKKEKQQYKLSTKARARSAIYQRLVAEAVAEHEKLKKLYGEMPDDMSSKTFVELESIIFGDAGSEAHALDAKWNASGAGEEV
jgi:hypothetical protein